MEEFLQVGVIASTHGLKGEVKVFPTTDDVRRFEELEYVLLETDKKGKMRLEIAGVKYFKQFAILKFKGIDTIDEIQPYKGRSLWVPREMGQELSENEYYIADLIGMEVYLEEGSLLGILKDVLETGANDVYSVMTADGKEVLIPAIRQCIQQVDVQEKKMQVHLLDGLV